jgi:hypothetical protein
MRDSLKRSLQHTPAGQFDRYPKGSVVLCNACSLPVFKLDVGISLGDRAGKLASAFKPLSLTDLAELGEREDIDSGVRATVLAMTSLARVDHISKLREMHAGDPMLCPVCHNCFAQVVAVDRHEVLDKSYTVELLTIPPKGQKATAVSGRRIGGKHWIH